MIGEYLMSYACIILIILIVIGLLVYYDMFTQTKSCVDICALHEAGYSCIPVNDIHFKDFIIDVAKENRTIFIKLICD